MFDVSDAFSPQQFGLPNVGYDPGVGDSMKAGSIPAPDIRSPRNPDARTSPNMPLAVVPENITVATTWSPSTFLFQR